MQQSLQAVRVGIFFVLGLLLIYVVFTVIGNRPFDDEEGYSLQATFQDLKTLTVGTDVRMAGVRIGTVQDIELVEGKGRATLQINPEIRIPADSVAGIGIASLLGQNYISIEYGSSQAPALSDGEAIAVRESVDLNDIMRDIGELGAKFNSVADSFSGDKMNSLFGNLNGMVIENREKIRTIVENLESITTTLKSGEGTLGKLMTDDTAYNELLTMVAEIKGAANEARSLFDEASGIMEDVKSGEGTLGQLLYDDTIATELNTAVVNIRDFSDKLNSGEGTLGKLVTDDSLYLELRAMLQKADQALDSVGDSGPITAVGAASGALF